MTVDTRAAVATLVAIGVLRMLPLVVVAFRSSAPARAAITACCALAVVGDLHSGGSLVRAAAIGYSYFCMVLWFLHSRLPHWLDQGRISQGASITGLFVLMVAVPATVLRTSASATAVVGWEFALSMHSFCVETQGEQRGIHDCMFFVLVDPTLLYDDRARRVSRPEVKRGHLALLRLAMGFAVGALAAGVLFPLAQATDGTGTTNLLVHGSLRFLALYAACSGLASVQIGSMRLLGYVASERYRFPFLAKDPFDFWRRWNTYVGRWARKYVFLRLARRRRTRRGLGAAVIATFVTVGILHDAYTYFSEFEFSLVATFLFLMVAIVCVMWSSLSRTMGAPPRVRGLLAQALTVALIVVGASFWG